MITAAPPLAPIVLLVDDQEDSNEMYSQFLRMCGFRTLEAENGAVALELARAERPDIVVSDLLLPVVSGFDLASRLRSDAATSQIPLIAVTGLTHASAMDRASRAGFDLVLIKPCLPDVLAVEIRRLLLRRAMVELRAEAAALRLAAQETSERATDVGADTLEQQPRTQERSRQEALRARMKRSSIAVLIADDEGRYVDANEGACQLTGYGREELTRLSLWDLTPAVDLADAKAIWHQFVERGELEGQFALRRKDKALVHVRFSARANVVPHLHVSALALDMPETPMLGS